MASLENAFEAEQEIDWPIVVGRKGLQDPVRGDLENKLATASAAEAFSGEA